MRKIIAIAAIGLGLGGCSQLLQDAQSACTVAAPVISAVQSSTKTDQTTTTAQSTASYASTLCTQVNGGDGTNVDQNTVNWMATILSDFTPLIVGAL